MEWEGDNNGHDRIGEEKRRSACVRACVRWCVRACVRPSVRECVRGCEGANVATLANLYFVMHWILNK